jgi:hypothetical protein
MSLSVVSAGSGLEDFRCRFVNTGAHSKSRPPTQTKSLRRFLLILDNHPPHVETTHKQDAGQGDDPKALSATQRVRWCSGAGHLQTVMYQRHESFERPRAQRSHHLYTRETWQNSQYLLHSGPRCPTAGTMLSPVCPRTSSSSGIESTACRNEGRTRRS